MARTLVETKLYAPHPRHVLVERMRLAERLNDVERARLVLVSAPTGFGKSTLVAEPDASVELADGGRRPVRAREAIGSERDRLWERFDQFPGWGDVEALAAHRSRTTAVVVLEPR